MRQQHTLFRLLFVLLLAVPFVSHGQNDSFESLWAVYKTIPYYNPSLSVKQLDTIERKAVREKDAYQQFRVNWERTYLDNRTDRISFREMLLRIDSLREMDIAVQWNDPDSALYRSLYHYLSGMVLMTASSSANTTPSNTQNTDIQRLEEWTKEDFRNAAKEHFRTCFDQMPTNIEYSNSVWGFLTTDDVVWNVFTPTLYDVLVQNCLDYFYKDKEMVEYLIEKVLNIPPLQNDQKVKIHFELLWLAHLYDLPDYPVDSSEYWKELDWLEKIYDPNEAFDYTRGVLLYSASQQTEEKNDYPARALKYFDRVMREGEIDYYRRNSSYYIERLTLPQIELTNAQYDLPPGHKLRIPITYANIDTLYVSVYRDDYDSRSSYFHYYSNDDVNKKAKGTYSTRWYSHSEQPVYTQRFILETHGKNLSYTTELWLDSLPLGHYEFFFHQRPELDSLGALMKTEFSVNRMKVSTWSEGRNHYIAVNDFNSGKPISWRSVNVPLKITRFTNRFGEIRYQRVLFCSTDLTKIHDKNVKHEYYYYDPPCYPWLEQKIVGRRYARRRMDNYFTQLFTDRTLYRPGQTAHFKFVLYGWKRKLIPNQTVVVQLQENKYPYAIIDSMQLTTNEFGSVAGEFKLPDKIGKYRIELKCPDKRIERWYNPTLEVAEYKLPSFKVKLLKDTAQTATGDTLTIRGKVTALSGYPIRDADVALSVNHIKTEQFNLYTDEDGYFTYRYAVPRSGVEIALYIEAIVTDLNGETHQDIMRVIMPPKLLTISVDLEKDFDLATGDTMQLVLQPVNFEKILQPVPLRVTIMRLKSPEHYRIPVLKHKPKRWEPHYSQEDYAQQFPHVTWDLNERSYSYWPVLETVYTTERLFCPDSLLLLDVHNWKTGDYKLLVEGTDKRGNPVKEERHFTVNHSSSIDFNAYMPIRVAFQEYPERTGKKMTLSVGSCLHNAVMICDVYQGGKRLKTLRIPLDHEQKLVTVKTRRNNDRYINVLARIVQNGELHHKEINYLIALDSKTRESIIRYLKDNSLTAELTHYHNVAEPGSNEEWEITIQDGNQNAAKEVEMLAWMMDCSLYELGMKEPDHKLNPIYRSSIPRAFRKKMRTTILRSECKDLSVAYPSYITFRQAKRQHLPSPYKKIRPLYNYTSMNDPQRAGDGVNYVVITYEPPVFSADNTAASGRDVRTALSDMAGVSSMDGTITSVRGNRSDGQQVIVDGMRVTSDVQVVETIEEGTPDEKEIPAPSPDIRVRTNFTETAFFYPQLRTDEQGRIKFRFTLPDQYTNWQFFATGHDKRLSTCELTAFLQSRRSFMLQSNAPRFLREGDTMNFAVKVVNISEKNVRGEVTLAFFNAEDNQPIKMIVGNGSQPFDVSANASQEVHFRLAIPENVPAVTYRIVARCTDSAAVAGDGEENILPVLPNRMLITESQHFVVPAHTDTAFIFQRYRTAQTPTLRPLSYTMEVTANPAWLAIQALPSLMLYPYECNEQLFSKLFAAAVVRHALKQNPELENIFERWRNDTLNGSLESPMLKNETLRNILLEETPWLSSAQSESKQRRKNAELFSADNLDRQLTQNLNKLMRNQLPSGGWDWYGRYGYSRYITDYLIAGFYKLQRLGVELSADAEQMLAKAIRQSDKAQEVRYQQYLERLKENPEAKFYFSEEDVHYLYARSFAGFDSVWLKKPYVQNLIHLSAHQIYTAPYMRQAEFALAMHHLGETEVARQIVEDLRYYAFKDKDLGMYWGESPSNRRKDWRIWGYYPWYEAPVERQAMLIEAFVEISPREEELTAMKQWLLLQKEGNSWKSTKASSAAVYALLLNAPKDLLEPATTTITVGDETFTPAQDENAEAGTGYLKHVWTAEAMTLQLADISIHTDSVHPAFGSCYWQYLEVPDRVTASGDGLTIRRTLLHRPAEGDGKHAEPVTAANPMRLGERITVRLVVTSDRELEYVHVKDPRTAAFEPVNIHERRGGHNGAWWVESPRDAAEHFFLNSLPQGTIIIEYDLYVTQTGTFSHAPATIECMYAPGHRGQSDGNRITVQ